MPWCADGAVISSRIVSPHTLAPVCASISRNARPAGSRVSVLSFPKSVNHYVAKGSTPGHVPVSHTHTNTPTQKDTNSPSRCGALLVRIHIIIVIVIIITQPSRPAAATRIGSTRLQVVLRVCIAYAVAQKERKWLFWLCVAFRV